MGQSTSMISGLISGLDWRTMIDQLMQLDHRSVDLLTTKKTKYEKQLDAWHTVNSNLLSLRNAASELRQSSAFEVFTSTMVSNTTTEPENLLSVATSEDASVGNYNIVVQQLAQAQKLSSQSFSSISAALGISGEILVNQKAISIVATDSLTDIRDKINGVNTGSSPSGVTASILAAGEDSYRLILTSDSTGEEGFSIAEVGSSTALADLGLVDGTVSIKNPTSDGAQSDNFSSTAVAIASLLELSSAPGATNVTIAGQTVSIDLTTDTLSDIANAIDSLSGVSATVDSTTDDDGNTVYYVDISGTTSFSDNNNVLQTLGILKGDQSAVNKIVVGSVANTTDGSTPITESTRFDQIYNASVGTGDTITIQGQKNDGTSITTTTFNIYEGGQYKTLADLLTEIETLYGGASVVDAYISDGTDGNTAGTIVLKDLTAGDSQLSLTLIANNEGGGNLDFGTISTATEGYNMEVVAGQDAKITVDGITYTDSSNSISDMIPGVTLNLKNADSSTTITLSVNRDIETIEEKITNLVDAYNEIIDFINQQFEYDIEKQEVGGVLFGDGTLRSVKSDLSSLIISKISNVEDAYSTLALVGIKLDNEGKLSINSSTLSTALQTNFSEVQKLFTAFAETTNTNVDYVYHTRNTTEGTYDINITQVAEKASVTGTVDLSSGLSGNETLTITDKSTGRVATINLTAGQTIDQIVSAINDELDTEYAQQLQSSNGLSKISSGYITSSTTWGEIDTTGLGSNDITNGDTISFSGTDHNGDTVSGSYTISDKDTDTVQGLLTAIENAFDGSVDAYIDSSGKIVITDTQVGTSSLSLTITENNEGGGSLDFGTVDTATTGRYQLHIEASKDASNHLVLTHTYYGSNEGFTISQTQNNLGITDGDYAGEDVAGTINGETADGQGQVLTGASDTTVEGLSIKYTGSSTGDQGSITLTYGIAEKLYNELFYIVDTYEGYVADKQESLQDNIDRIENQIDLMETRLEHKRDRLILKYVTLETTMARLTAQGNWLSAQVNNLH